MPAPRRDATRKLSPPFTFGALDIGKALDFHLAKGDRNATGYAAYLVQPEFEPFSVVFGGAKESEQLAVRGELDLARRSAGERFRAEQAGGVKLQAVASSRAANSGRVRFSTPSALTATLSSMRMPPQRMNDSTFAQLTASRSSMASSSMGMK